ncbi:uncharacterized protein LOC126668199 [Mercurialis annua]|uniref:uncharacterized protein LOC126668199 n=1 Tax=Mercurialis annua TaxID=3986 RepID=UPI002160AD2B|nr:uncharacterized protein LOC126668199 [Mercurialis annua]
MSYSLDALPIKSLSDVQDAFLSVQFCEKEIFDTLMTCDGNKASGSFRYYGFLTDRISPVLPLVISKNQFGFIKERSIHDCHMIASVIIHLVKRRREQVFLLKLDFMIAFNTISWSFILDMLHKMNFDQKWTSWISSHFDSTQLSSLLRRSYLPYALLLVVESRKALFSKAASSGLFSGVHIDGLDEPVSILQFADDTLLFVPNDLQMIENLLRILS